MSESANSIHSHLNWLYGLQRRGIKVGLQHTRDLLISCGDPQNDFPAIHLAGTNGKGSTAAMIAAILKAAGYRVGLYSSPHLIHFNERIRINGKPISDQAIVEFSSAYRVEIDRIESTFFEATTALALWYFARKKVDVAVVETGLGGRLDSTNILKPVVTIITPVDLDHTELLGSNINKIAVEKAGIIKSDTPLILAPQVDPAAEIIRRKATAVGAPIVAVEISPAKIKLTLNKGTEFRWRDEPYLTALLGRHQATNAVAALEAVNSFDPQITAADCRSGLALVRWPGRLQLLRAKPPVFYDVAHNQHGVRRVLAEISDLFNQPPVGVLALKADKELSPLAEALKGRFYRLIATTVPEAGLMTAADLGRRLRIEGVQCEVLPQMSAAVNELDQDKTGRRPWLFFGSHYIAKLIFWNFDFSFESGVI